MSATGSPADHLIEIDRGSSDEEITSTLVWWLEHPEELAELTRRGQEVARLHTQEKYAERFALEARHFLAQRILAPSESTITPPIAHELAPSS